MTKGQRIESTQAEDVNKEDKNPKKQSKVDLWPPHTHMYTHTYTYHTHTYNTVRVLDTFSYHPPSTKQNNLRPD